MTVASERCPTATERRNRFTLAGPGFVCRRSIQDVAHLGSLPLRRLQCPAGLLNGRFWVTAEGHTQTETPPGRRGWRLEEVMLRESVFTF